MLTPAGSRQAAERLRSMSDLLARGALCADERRAQYAAMADIADQLDPPAKPPAPPAPPAPEPPAE